MSPAFSSFASQTDAVGEGQRQQRPRKIGGRCAPEDGIQRRRGWLARSRHRRRRQSSHGLLERLRGAHDGLYLAARR